LFHQTIVAALAIIMNGTMAREPLILREMDQGEIA
jgi:hypothetical protein